MTFNDMHYMITYLKRDKQNKLTSRAFKITVKPGQNINKLIKTRYPGVRILNVKLTNNALSERNAFNKINNKHTPGVCTSINTPRGIMFINKNKLYPHKLSTPGVNIMTLKMLKK